MSEPLTREELSARIEAIEARAETRQVELNAKIDRLSDNVQIIATSVEKSREEARKDNAFTRWTIAGIAVASALAVVGIVVSTQGTMATANGNVLSAIQAALAVKSAPISQSPITPQK